MFGRDPLTGLQKLLGKTTRYLDEDGGRLNVEALQNAYQLAAQNAKLANERSGVMKAMDSSKFQPGDMVTIHDHMAKAFEPKYKGDKSIVKFLGKTQVLIRSAKGEEMKQHIAYLKKTNPVEEIVNAIPDFRKFGQAAKLHMNPDLVQDLEWKYEVTEVTCVMDKPSDVCWEKLIQIAKLLILHLCFRYICYSQEKKTPQNFYRFHKVLQCLYKAHTNKTF